MDRSDAALGVARGNAERLGLNTRAQMIAADWTQDRWGDGLGRFDLVLANPPYVETGAALDPSVAAYEPHGALFAGPQGLDDYRVLLQQMADLLAPGGIALIEIGWTQGAAVSQLARAAGLTAQIHADLAGRPRAIEIFVESNQIPRI
jgi:release factor glutamine methyltransferase